MRRWMGLIAGLLVALLPTIALGEVTDEDLARAREQRERMQQDLNTAADAYNRAIAAVEVTRADIERTTKEVAAVQARHEEARLIVSKRAVAAYKGEKATEIGAVLGARDMNNMIDRAAYLQRASASDNAVIERLRVTGIDLRNRRADLARLEEQQKETVQREEALRKDLESKLEEAKAYESTLIGQRAAEDEARRRAAEAEARRQAAAEEAARQAAAQAAIAASGGHYAGDGHDHSGDVVPPSAPVHGGPISSAVGSIVCPVAGTSAYSDTWGDPRSGGRSHQGTDMFSSRGTPVVAAADGVVEVQEGGAGGRMIFLYAGSDTYMYAHLDTWTVADGQSVVAGQQIGTVGSSGNVDEEATHLHFEYHPGGSKVNPYGTVASSC